MKRDLIRCFFVGPPLAVARVGSGRTPLDNFQIGQRKTRSGAAGGAEIKPALTLDIDADGNLHSFMPRNIRFKAPNGQGKLAFRPVCPWFELWCEGEDADGQRFRRPVLPDDFPPTHPGVGWDIELGNRRACAVTQSRGDIIRSPRLMIAPGDVRAHAVSGWSQDATENEPPLVSGDRAIALGSLRAARPHADYGYRARFTPPAGHVYGPGDLADRLAKQEQDKANLQPPPPWRHLAILREDLRATFLILNPQAHWCGGRPQSPDAAPQRVANGLLRSVPADGTPSPGNNLAVPLGLMDDMSDGIIGCSFDYQGKAYRVCARVLVGPPDFSPDRRPTLSLADLLRDRAYQRDRRALIRTYDGTDRGDGAVIATTAITDEIQALFRDFFAGDTRNTQDMSPRDFKDLVNAPPNEVTGQPAQGNSFDKIPVSTPCRNTAPMHLTRWQYDLLDLWVRRLEEASMASVRAVGEPRHDA